MFAARADGTGFDRYSPLRDNRPLLLERLHAELALLTNTPWKPVIQSLVWSAMDVRQNLTTHSGAQPIRSIRLLFDPEIDPDTRMPTAFLQVVSGISERQGLRPDSGVNFEGRYSAPELLQRASKGDPRDLFRAYAEALLPHTGEVDPPDPYWTGDTSGQFKTLFYGHDPVRALIAAAHMTANATDMYDAPAPGSVIDTVTAVTVVTSEAAKDTIEFNDPRYPAWSKPGSDENNFPLRLVLDQGKLPERLLAGEVPAVNVFGIEAQPFVVEVNSYFMYSDVWLANGGDLDGGTFVPGPFSGAQAPFTIDGEIVFDNEDFIMEALAFQLTNPFDTPVHLWATGSRFYLEFGGHLFPLGRIEPQASNKVPENYAELVANTPGLADVILGPGKTKVFYALSFKESVINDRLDKTVLSGVREYAIGSWINAQFGEDAIPIPVAAGPGDLVKLVKGDGTGEDTVVLLWRALDLMRDLGTGEAVRTDDLLVDRLRDAATGPRATLDRSLPAGNRDVAGSKAFKENTIPRRVWGDNDGYSIVRSGTIRRVHGGTVGSGSSVAAKTGEFPAWCIENKFDLTSSMNFEEKIGGGDTGLSMGEDFNNTSASGTAAPGNHPMSELFNDQAGVPSNKLFGTLLQDPWEKAGGFGSNRAGTSY
ncbi:MAG: hypothetical protein IID31_13380, partial [Planctomycetes bacterium]|nr:hypothetical protein [Planctomycetota bacterium]